MGAGGGVGVANREIGVPGAAVGWVGGWVVVGEGEDWLGGVVGDWVTDLVTDLKIRHYI